MYSTCHRTYYDHYVPGDVALYLEHPPDASPEGIHAALSAHAEALSDDHLRTALLTRPRIHTFHAGVAGTQSASIAYLSIQTIDPRDVPTFGTWVRGLVDKLKPTRSPVLGTTLKMATLNWLASGAPNSNPDGVGGPAAAPVAYTLPTNMKSIQGTSPWIFNLPIDLDSDQRGEGVEVAVLDTAPDQKDLDSASARFPDHPFLGTLLGPNEGGAKLSLWFPGFTHLLQLVDYRLPGHPYVMSDHGLFSAGIIHTIAPMASITLVEVLNPFGVGTLETLTMGLAELATRDINKPLIVNCSWVLNLPHRHQPEFVTREHPIYQYLNLATLESMGEPIQWICDLLRDRNVVLIAAAGNDGEHHKSHPAARYPAAFESVLGVGALNNNGTPAPYSNKCDRPPVDGFATLGGDIVHNANGWVTDSSSGILGAYIGTFPNGVRSVNGWARWSGTSFAAPVISGTLAALLSNVNPINANDVERARDMIGAKTLKTPTRIGAAFNVTQG